MTDFDPQIESELKILKEAIKPSKNLFGRLAHITINNKRHDKWHIFNHMKKILIPALVIFILIVAGVSLKKDELSPQNVSINDKIINTIVNDVLADQSIIDEANADVALINEDGTVMDSFIDSYNPNEY